jgi:7-keto-8-aminopelargonate synthetase-like enzyme
VPVASLASALAGLEVNEREGDQLRAKLYRLSHRLATGARDLGFEVDNAGGFPIVFVVTGGYERTVKAINLAWEYGLLITPGIFPIVPYRRGGLRFSLTALNTDEEIETTLSALKEIRQRISE